MKTTLLMIACLTCLIPASLRGEDDDVQPEDFAGADGRLDQAGVVEYLLCRKEITYSKLKSAGGPTPAGKQKAVTSWLVDLEDHIGKPPPYTPEEVRTGDRLGAKDKKEPGVVKGLLKEPATVGSAKVGPIRIRKSVDDWSKPMDEVSGATFSYQNDRLASTHTWSSEGAIIYPITVKENNHADADSAFLSSKWSILPAASWKLTDLSNQADGEVEDLMFQLPISFEGNRRLGHRGQWREEWKFSPFFQTDFHGEGQVLGASLNYEPLFQIGDHFDVGQWHSLLGGKTAYLLRLRPRLEFSEVLQTSRFLNRPEGDGWFRGGGNVDVAVRPFGQNSPWELSAGYSMLYNFSGGSDAYSDLFEAKATFWINENMGLSLTYQNGETPVSDKEIDLLTIGFELKL